LPTGRQLAASWDDGWKSLITIAVAALGVAGTLSAAVVAVRTQTAATRRESARRMRTAAMMSYVAAVNTFTGELAALPNAPGKQHGWVRRNLARRGGEVVLYLLARILERAIFGPRLREQVDRLAEAHAQLVVSDVSDDLIEVVNEVNRFIGAWSQDAARHKAQWPELAHRLDLAVAQETTR
jgi:hypothetical protein